ncbi:hypothetical protein BOX15_Mlig025185g3 [Macrostomum lignano]|uniref:Coronin n=2 Tax=Macrostomum lignano TaxID=282301 RepID=A0A267E2X8_9PLAT|nr:hypothetical protein BOX15_Mlig025185g3 [Macrostomum lignano]
MWRKPVSKYKNAQAAEQPAQAVKFAQIGLAACTEGPELVACNRGVLLATSCSRLCLWQLADEAASLQPVSVAGGISGQLSDLQLSPFSAADDDSTLAAAATADGRLALLSVSSPKPDSSAAAVQLRQLIDAGSLPISRLQFSPSAGHLLAACGASSPRLSLIDVEAGKSVLDIADVGIGELHSVAWTSDSGQLAVSSGAAVRLWDPRVAPASSASGASWKAPGMSAEQPSLARCLQRPGGGGGGGGSPLIALSGFDSSGRERRLGLFDPRTAGVAAAPALASESLGRAGRRGGEPAKLLADWHTGMLFWAAPGDESVTFAELEGPDDRPSFAIRDRFLLPDEQVLDLALVDKFSLDVGRCEVNRVAMVTNKSVRLVSYRVPRKTVSSFHADLFPDCPGRQPAMRPADWLTGRTAEAPLESLDPAKKISENYIASQTTADSSKKEEDSEIIGSDGSAVITSSMTSSSSAVTSSPHVGSLSGSERATKLRNVATAIGQRSTWLTELRQLMKLDLPPEAETLAANDRWVALPVTGPGGRVLVLPVRLAAAGGRIDSLPGRRLLRHEGAGVTAVAFEPFDAGSDVGDRLAVALDTGAVCVWRLDSAEAVNEGEVDWSAGDEAEGDAAASDRHQRLRGHSVRALLLAWHPRASHLLASVAADGEVRLWNLADASAAAVVSAAPSPAVAACWTQCGRQLLLLGRDGRLHALSRDSGTVVWSSSPNVVAGLKQPLRAGRLASVLGGRAALVSGFAASNAAARRLALVRLDGLGDGDSEGEPWKQVGECADFTDGGTAPLSLSADPDLHLVTYWSRGDRTLAHLTIGWDCGVAPLLGSEHRDSRVLVAAAWLTKRTVDAASVEVARGFRLTAEGTLETVSVAVPRVIDQLFQDDLLGRCSVTWQPSLSAANWLSGSDPSPLLWPSVSLQPEGMPSVTQVASDPQLQLQFSQKQQPAKQQKQQQQAAKVRQVDALDLEQQQQQKETELVTAMLATVQADAGPLPQDLMEGADSDEWSDD